MIGQIPPDLLSEVRQLTSRGDAHLAAHDWAAAVKTFATAYSLMLDNQPPGIRFDKADVLLRRGLGETFGDYPPSPARRSGILSLVETLLTRIELEGVEGAAYLEWQAARNAQALAQLPQSLVEGLVRDLRHALEAGRRELRDPEEIAFVVGVADMWAIGGLEGKPVYRPGEFTVPWSQRVFVGGSYQAHIADLAEMADEVRQFGWTPVLLWNYVVPAGFTHHHSLMLLHECRWAMFEVTAAGGQLMELERCRDYLIDPLVVYQGRDGHGRISAMVSDLLIRLGISPEPYSDIPSLRALVRTYLTSAARVAGTP